MARNVSWKFHLSLALLLALAISCQAEGPAIFSKSFHMTYGLPSDPTTPQLYVQDVWHLRGALNETKLPEKTIRELDKRLQAASDELVPLWRQSEQNPADAADINAKAATVFAALETDINRILDARAAEQLKDRLVIRFMQELIVPCPDAVWGAPDFMHLNMTEKQKQEIDDAFSKADERVTKTSVEFEEAAAKDPAQISVERVEKLRLALAERRHAMRSRLTAEQLEKWDSYMLSEAKKSAAEEAKTAAGKPKG
jgi:hypothetical protein